MDLHFIITQEILRLQKQIQDNMAALQAGPEGYLSANINGTSSKWFLNDTSNGNRIYLPKSTDPQYVSQLALNTWLKMQIEHDRRELEALKAYERKKADPAKNPFDLLSSPAYQKLLLPQLGDREAFIQKWKEAPYRKNPHHREFLTVRSTSGEFVRSKSEAFYYDFLYANNIAFRYEEELDLGGNLFYPDFTILHPITLKIYLHEHFGMMDDPEYASKAFRKLQIYNSFGWVPMQNLLITTETKDYPLDHRQAMNLYGFLFLD